ncbi:ATP10 protein-domain-containing protein [Blastocladiella britannica]|nr:ATP10 protein-domain-containing protein [Blastocladiella britannica]
MMLLGRAPTLRTLLLRSVGTRALASQTPVPPTPPTTPTTPAKGAAQQPATPPSAPAPPPSPPQTPASLPRRVYASLYNFFSKERRLERRPSLQKEFHESYWKDLHEINKTKGKLYTASSVLAKPAHATAFPALMVHPLHRPDDKINILDRLAGNVSLVTIATSTYGDNHTKSFEMPFRSAFPDLPVAQISMADTPAKSWVLRVNMRYTAAKVPKAVHPWYFVSMFEDVDPPLKHLAITNRYIGWVYLVDAKGRVRWRAHGIAEAAELEALGRCTQELLNESQ